MASSQTVKLATTGPKSFRSETLVVDTAGSSVIPVPKPPASGNYRLESHAGVLTWVSAA